MKLLITGLINTARIFLLAVFLVSAIAFNNNAALADTVKADTAGTVKQAAREVTKDTGAKEQFGKSKSGNDLIDKAQNKANKKLNNLAQEADSDKELPASKKLFLDNLTTKK